jgi:peptide/nickel transport system permease protein
MRPDTTQEYARRALADSVAVAPSVAQREARGSLARMLVNSFLLRSLLKAIATIFVVTTFSFILIRGMPGSPMEVYINDLMAQYSMPYDDARQSAEALYSIDMDDPIYVQYLDYLGNVLRGNLGQSILSRGTYVTDLMLKFMPWTLFSVGTALLLSFSIGIGLGMLMAYRRDSALDHALSAVASITQSVPNYLIGLMLIVFLGIQLQIVPIAAMRGSMSPGMQPHLGLDFVIDVFFHAALPIATYFLTTVGVWMLTMKSSTVAALEEDYVTVARARGLSDSRITTAYVGRNAILPLFTQLTIAAGFVIGGSAFIEFVFVYQGIGYVLLESINKRDYTVMQGVFLTITISVIVANVLADLVYSRLDPRIRMGGGSS